MSIPTYAQPYSYQDDLYLMTRLKKGGDIPQVVANRLRRTVGAIQQRKSMLKQYRNEAVLHAEFRKLTKQDKAIIAAYRMTNELQPDEIAKLLGFDRITVYGVLAEPLDWNE